MGFKLSCLDCGKEIVIEKGDVSILDFNELGIYPVQGRVIIECDCGNESDMDY